MQDILIAIHQKFQRQEMHFNVRNGLVRLIRIGRMLVVLCSYAAAMVCLDSAIPLVIATVPTVRVR